MNSRRMFLQGMAGLTCCISTLRLSGAASAQNKSQARQTAITAWQQRIRAILERGRLPIIDLQATYIEGRTNVPRMIEYMNENDVAQIAFAPAFAANSKPSLDLHLKHPAYFIPTTNSGEFPRWWQDPLTFLAGVREDLKSGDYYFMGEHEFRHYPSPEQVKGGRSDRDITLDIAGPSGQALFKLSEDTGIAFQIHYEIEDRLLAALEGMLERYPRAKPIWCHLAMIRYPDRAKRYNPEYVAGLINRFPGLHFDLAVPSPNNVYGPSGARDSTLYTNGQLDNDWKTLMEKYPERFLASSDYRPPVENDYPQQISRQRSLILSALSDTAKHLIAYGNAWRLITGTTWSS